ncbi:hypothetical protein CRUP_009323 [Coryphaenoides rupestris]|nr:hypothetical protein CRUP_009323 [Coryphaenoides rupestris]
MNTLSNTECRSPDQNGAGRRPQRPKTSTPLTPSAGPPPLLSPTGPTDWPLRNVQRQAKRARVESIIRDMAGSFSSSSSSSSSHEPDIDGATEEVQENTGHREWSQGGPHETQRGGAGYRNSEDQTIGTQLQSFRCRPVRRSRSSGGLRPREDWARDSDKTKEEPPLEEPWSFGSDSTGTDHNDTFADPNCSDDFEVPSGRIRACGRKKLTMVTMTNTPQWKKKPDIVNALMADILKYELSRAVSVSVDSIFKSMPLLEPPAVGMEMTHAPHRSPLLDYHQGTPPTVSPYEDNVNVPEVQTEALSLVVQKPWPTRSNALPSLLGPPRQHHPKPDFYSFSHRTDLPSEDQASGCLKGGGGMDQAVGFKKKTSKEAAGGAFMLSRSRTSSTKVRCKVNSRSVRGSQTVRRFAMDPVFLEGLCVPLDVDVKSDGSQGVLMSNFFSLAGGLTTSHLKKAKLMFFYTRYPSSLVLKTFFHDVQVRTGPYGADVGQLGLYARKCSTPSRQCEV